MTTPRGAWSGSWRSHSRRTSSSAAWLVLSALALAACEAPPIVDVPARRIFDSTQCCTKDNASVYLRFDCDRAYPELPFARASAATFINDDGRVELAAANEPRCESAYAVSGARPLGLLVERASENLLLDSAQLGSARWASGSAAVSVDADAAVAPDGSFGAERISDTGAATTARRTQAVDSAGEGFWTCSAFLKADTSSDAELTCERRVGGATTVQARVAVNLATGALQPSGEALESGALRLSDGWWRVWVTFGDDNVDGEQTLIAIYPRPASDADSTGAIYAWGAQLEAQPIVTSYIPTGASTVERPPDVVDIDVSAVWIPRAVTIACHGAPRFAPRPWANLRTLVSFDEDPMATGYLIGVAEGTNILGAFVRAIDPPRYDVLTLHEGAQDWDDNERRTVATTVNGEPADLRLAIDGGVVAGGAGLDGRALPAVTTMRVGTAGLGAAAWDGHVRGCALWSFSVSDDDLAQLSGSFVP